MPFQSSIFVNIPVGDLEASTKFYIAIGFIKNQAWSSEQAAMMHLPANESEATARSDNAINIMLLKQPFFDTFLPSGIERANPQTVAQCFICLARPSKESIDIMANNAAANGGKKDVREKTDLEVQMENMGMYGKL